MKRHTLSLGLFVLSILLSLFLLLPSAAAGSAIQQAGTEEELRSAVADPACSVIELVGDIVIQSEIELTRDIGIQGNGHTISVPKPGLDESGILNSSASQFRVFNIQGTGIRVGLTNLTVMGGMDAQGAGLNIESGASVSLDRVTITRCNGGGSCGGGIYNGYSASVVVRNCQINRNAASFGGGFVNYGEMVIDNSSFSENRSLSQGGGAGENNGQMYVNNCTFSNNKSWELGGALNDYNGMAYIMNSTFTGNVAVSSYNGGAIRGSASVLVNCLFAYNYHVDGSSYIIDDISSLSRTMSNDLSSATLIACVHQAETNGSANIVGIGLQKYSALPDGSDEFLFAGGTLTKVLDNDGSQMGTGLVYQPYLYTPESSYSSMVPLKTPTSALLSNGVKTLYDPYSTPKLFAYYNTTEAKWYYNIEGSWLAFEPTPEQLAAEVTIDQSGEEREDTIGGTSHTESELYMIRLLHLSGQNHGTVHGVTVYGDVYRKNDLATIITIPSSGYYFSNWTEKKADGSTATFLDTNPGRFSVTRSVELYPTYSETPAEGTVITAMQNGVIRPLVIDLSDKTGTRLVTSSGKLVDSATNAPLGGMPVTYYIINKSNRVVFEKTKNTAADGTVSFVGSDGWTAVEPGEYQALVSYTGDSTHSASFLEEKVIVIADTYSITYNIGAGAAAGIPSPLSSEYGTSFYVAPPTRPGYTFLGWKVTGTGYEQACYGATIAPTTQIESADTLCSCGDNRGMYFKNLTLTGQPVTLTAQWRVHQYNITYDYAGGIPSDDAPTTRTVYDVPFTAPALQHPSNLAFAGWSVTGVEPEVALYGGDPPTTSIAGELSLCTNGASPVHFSCLTTQDEAYITLNARWMMPFSLSLTLDNVAWSGKRVELRDDEYAYLLSEVGSGGAYSTSAVPSGSYQLYIDNSDIGLPVTVSQTSTSLSLQYFSVNFHTNGGQPQPATQYIQSGSYAQYTENPWKDSYDFMAWYQNADFSGEPWSYYDAPITQKTDVYARWLCTDGAIKTFVVPVMKEGVLTEYAGVIDNNSWPVTIKVTLPDGTDVSRLIPQFTTGEGANVRAGQTDVYESAVQQTSGTTAINFFVPKSRLYYFSESETYVYNAYNWYTNIYHVIVVSKPVFAQTTLPAGVAAQPYRCELPYQGSLLSDMQVQDEATLPAGLSLDSSGVLSGTPTTAGTYTFTVSGKYYEGETEHSVSETLTLTVNQGVSIVTTALPAQYIGEAYACTLEAIGTAPITWSVAGGSTLPSWLTLDPATGTLTCAANEPSVIAGAYTFSLQAVNAAGTDIKAFTLNVWQKPLITTTSLPDATADVRYGQSIAVTAFPNDCVLSIIAGTLPEGLALDSASGAIAGTTTHTGRYAITIRALGTSGLTTQTLTLLVGQAPQITTTSLPAASQNDSFAAALAYTGYPAPTWSVDTGSALPNGITLNPTTGRLSGTPTVTGGFTFTVRATNGFGNDTQTFSLDITGRSSLTPPDDVPNNGVTASVTFDKATPVLEGAFVTATVTLSGIAQRTGEHTIGLSSTKAGPISAPISCKANVNRNTWVGSNTQFYFTFVMPATAVDDFQLVNSFVATPHSVALDASNAGIAGFSYRVNDAAVDTPYTQTFTVDDCDRLQITAAVVPGYTFDCWTTGETVNPLAMDSVTENISLSATATMDSYTIFYTLNGGTLPTGYPTSYNVDTATFGLPNPTKTGYDFTGWSGTDLTGEANKNVSISKGSVGHRSYQAYWEAHTYTVRYFGNGSTSGSTVQSEHCYDVKSKLTANGYAKTNKHFVGWARSATAATAEYSDEEAVLNLSAERSGIVDLYAVWSDKQAVDVTYQAMNVVFDGLTHPFAYTATPADIDNITVRYKPDGAPDTAYSSLAPSMVGVYDVQLTRPEDAVYQSLECTVKRGIRITPATITSIAVTGLAEPTLGAVPATTALCNTEGIATVTVVNWLPSDAHFVDDTDYSVAIELATDANHALAAAAALRCTINGRTAVVTQRTDDTHVSIVYQFTDVQRLSIFLTPASTFVYQHAPELVATVGHGTGITAEDLLSVRIGVHTLDPRTEYSAQNGQSILVTLKPSFLNQVTVGTHTLRVTLRSGIYAETTITTAEPPPATGDDTLLPLWISLLLASGLGALVIVHRSRFGKKSKE